MEEKKKYLLVVNPISGDVDKADLLNQTEEFAKQARVVLMVYETTGEADQHNIRKLYQQHQPERVLVAGGDGTIKMVGEALLEFDVVFGILPAGSANGLSVDLNLPDNLEENLEIAFHGKTESIDLICLNGKKSIHLSDLGLNAQLIKNYESGSVRGKLGYALNAISTLADLDPPFAAKVMANGQTIDCVARMIVIANSQKYGTGVTINPEGKMDDGRFEIIILKNLDLLIFGKILTGNMPLDSDDVEIISTDAAEILTEVPVSFQIDGEYIGAETRLEVTIFPGQMKVAVPAVI